MDQSTLPCPDEWPHSPLSSLYGHELIAQRTVLDQDKNVIGAFCKRVSDGQVRFYGLDNIKSQGGNAVVMEILNDLPKYEVERN
jgi:hypothetical protein